MAPSVYLAGPITGLTYDEAQDWRAGVRSELWDAGIEAFSPLRVKHYLREHGVLEDQYQGINALSDGRGIIARDRNDVRRRDMVLANLVGAERVSIGTVMEIAWADAFRTPVVIAMEPENVHQHAMVVESVGFIVPTLEEAIEIVKAVLLP